MAYENRDYEVAPTRESSSSGSEDSSSNRHTQQVESASFSEEDQPVRPPTLNPILTVEPRRFAGARSQIRADAGLRPLPGYVDMRNMDVNHPVYLAQQEEMEREERAYDDDDDYSNEPLCPLWVQQAPFYVWVILHLFWDLFFLVIAIHFQLSMPEEKESYKLKKNGTILLMQYWGTVLLPGVIGKFVILVKYFSGLYAADEEMFKSKYIVVTSM